MHKKENMSIIFNNTYPKIIDVFPEPEPTINFVPEWYRNQPGYYNNDRNTYNGTQLLTVKKCSAFFDSMSLGYMLLCPIDISIDTTVEPPIFDIPSQYKMLYIPMIGHHSAEQISHYPINKETETNFLLRINMVWVISTEKGTSCLFIDPQHKDKSPLKAISAVIDTDEFYSDGLFSFTVEKGFKGIIKKGTPLVQVIPFKRDSWKHQINNNFDPVKDLRHQKYKIRSVFNGGYKKYFWKKKEYK